MSFPFFNRNSVRFTKIGVPTKKRSGPVFYAGNYPDKGIAVTEADLHKIAQATRSPVEFDSEHGPSLFDGLLGYADNFRVALDAQGRKALFADWYEPEPLTQLLGDTHRSISVAFDDWKTRAVTKIALAKFPRVADAAFFSAVQGAYTSFSQHQPVAPLANFTGLEPAPITIPSVFAYHSTPERDAIAYSDFADPVNSLFPVRTEEEMRESISQIWNAQDPTTVRNNILEIAARKGFRIENSWWWPDAQIGVSRDFPADYANPYFSHVPEFEAQPYNLNEMNAQFQQGQPFYPANPQAQQQAGNPQISPQFAAHQAAQAAYAQAQQAQQNPYFAQPFAAPQQAVQNPAPFPAPQFQPQQFAQPQAQQAPSSLWEKFCSFFGTTPEAQAQAAFSAQAPGQLNHSHLAAQANQNAHYSMSAADAMSAQFAAINRKNKATQAVQLLFSQSRILPTQVDSVVAEMERALEDDALMPKMVVFSTKNAQGADCKVQLSRYEALLAHYNVVPAHGKTGEQVQEFSPEHMALFSRENTQVAQQAGVDQIDPADYLRITGKPLEVAK